LNPFSLVGTRYVEALLWLAAASYTNVCSQPTLPRSLEQGFEAPDFGRVPFRLGCFHLPKKGEEPLV
jgi:hypothetical protein